MAEFKPTVPSMEGKSYARYSKELAGWNMITSINEAKRGMIVALSLPEKGYKDIKEKVFNELSTDDLASRGGLKKLTDFMDKHLKKADLEACWEHFVNFLNCKRNKEPVCDYVSDFDTKYNMIKCEGLTLPSSILAFMLLYNANITEEDRKLVCTGIDFKKKENMYDEAKESLQKYKGDFVGASASRSSDDPVAVKVEPGLNTDNETLAASAYYAERNNSFGNSGRGSYYAGQGGAWGGARPYSPVPSRKMNPVVDGKVAECHCCGSKRHFIADCPHAYENSNNTQATFLAKEEERFCLFTGHSEKSIGQLCCEARNSAVIDSGCTSSVMGEKWFECYKHSMSESEKSEMKIEDGRKVLKFGGGQRLRSKFCVHLPCRLGGKDVMIKADVIESDIPLLLSLDALRKAHFKLDLEKDEAKIFGRTVSLNYTSSGHMCVPVENNRTDNNEISLNCDVKEDCSVLDCRYYEEGGEKCVTDKSDGKDTVRMTANCARRNQEESEDEGNLGSDWRDTSVIGPTNKAGRKYRYLYYTTDCDHQAHRQKDRKHRKDVNTFRYTGMHVKQTGGGLLMDKSKSARKLHPVFVPPQKAKAKLKLFYEYGLLSFL